MSKYELTKGLIEDLNDNRDEILSSEYPEDLLDEFTDSHIPIYNYELISIVKDDFNFGYVDDKGLLPRDNVSIFDIIRTSVYEYLTEKSYEWLNKNLKKENI